MIRAAIRRTLRALGLEIRRVSRGVDPSWQLFQPKVTKAHISQMLSQLSAEQPGRVICILRDNYVDLPAEVGSYIDCSTCRLGVLDAWNFDKTVFLYACDSDDIGLPWIREIVRRRGRFFPVAVYTPSTYAHINDTARRTLECEFRSQSDEGFQKWDFGPGDFLNLVQAIDITSGIEGDYLEIGCFRGSSACAALRYMREKRISRTCYFFDSFDGFSYDAARRSSDAMWVGSHVTEGEATVRQRIEAYANQSEGLTVCVERRNIVEEDLPAQVVQIALANVDVDLYEAVAASLEKIAPRIVPGGLIIVEDAGHTPALIGSRLALQQFLESEWADGFVPVYLESGQTLLMKAKISKPRRADAPESRGERDCAQVEQ